MFTIDFAEQAIADLKELKAFERTHILDKIKEQLTHKPEEPTRNKKPVVGLKPPWDSEKPVWELRIGEFRVFYDVDQDSSCVMVQTIRHKPPHLTTEDIL